jgi:hypothetical protein
MDHIHEDDLILYHYGELDDAARGAMDTHLQECAECAVRLQRLESVLGSITEESLPVPARDDAYGAQVWARIAARLPGKRLPWWKHWMAPPQLRLAGAFASLILLAFLLGRLSKSPAGPDASLSGGRGPERVILVAVGQHLEKSQMVLVEQRARDLLAANRLYKQSAQKVGDPAVNVVLDDLERVLVEIANAPDDLSPAELAAIQKRIEAQGLLFKIRVVESKVRKSAARPGSKASSAHTEDAQRSL